MASCKEYKRGCVRRHRSFSWCLGLAALCPAGALQVLSNPDTEVPEHCTLFHHQVRRTSHDAAQSGTYIGVPLAHGFHRRTLLWPFIRLPWLYVGYPARYEGVHLISNTIFTEPPWSTVERWDVVFLLRVFVSPIAASSSVKLYPRLELIGSLWRGQLLRNDQ